MKNRLALALFVTTLAGSPAHAVAPGAVEGRLAIDGKPIALHHAYAATEQSAQGDEVVRVVLADRALSEEELAAFPDSVLSEINAGRLHALRFLILDRKGTLDATDVFDAAGMPTIKAASRLEIETFTESAISGRLHVDSAQKFGDWNMTVDYDLRFAAPIRQAGE